MSRINLSICLIAFAMVSVLGGCNADKEELVNAPVTEHISTETSSAPSDESTSTPPEREEATSAAPAVTVLPKVLSLKLEPALVFPGTMVTAVVETSEPQADSISLDYSWERNGEPVSGQNLEELDTSEFRKGDVLVVLVTPSAGGLTGETQRSRPVVVLNRPPEITSTPAPTITDGLFTYVVTADDPDGDKLSFALEDAPSGMNIDAASGKIDWVVPTEFDGKIQVRVVVSDGDAKAFQSFAMNVTSNRQ